MKVRWKRSSVQILGKVVFLGGRQARRRRRHGFSLAEVIISVAIAAVSLGGIVWGYILAGHRTEWSTYSAAAHLMAMRQLEQTRAAKWDPRGYPPVDDLVSTNFPPVTMPLNLPQVGTNIVTATSTTTITDIPTDPPVRMIRVDCSWSVMGRGPFTNTLVTYRAPDQ